MKHRQELDKRLASLREGGAQALPSRAVPKRGIGVKEHPPHPSLTNPYTPSRMGILRLVKAILVMSVLTIASRYVASSLGYDDASLTISYIGAGLLSVGTAVVFLGALIVKYYERKSSQPRRGKQ